MITPGLRMSSPQIISVAIVHPRMGRGGSEALVMWGVEALKRDFRVTVITTNQADLNGLNSFYGTAVTAADVAVRVLRTPLGLRRIRGAAALRGAFFQRALRTIASDYDILISAYNLCDFGVPAIHLLDLSWDEDLRRRFAPAPGGLEGIFHRLRTVRAVYLALARTIARPSGRDLFSGEDLLFAYSRWIASMIELNRGVKCGVLYPPVPGAASDIAFEARSDAFVCLGRVSEEKRLERVVDILSRVRQQGHKLTLHVVGKLGSDNYARKIKALASPAPWIVLEGAVSAERKAHLLSTCRYGIHGADGEGFGIAVAEMIKAGCITFAPAEGGPAEILDNEALLYQSVDDAVEKIVAVLTNGALRGELTRHLRRQAKQFSTEHFMTDIRRIVGEFVNSESRPRVARPVCRTL